jgi:hypothetical protein
MLVLVVLTERAASRYRLDLAGPDAVEWSLAERLARGVGTRAGVEVLAFGTSITSYGFVPSGFERVTGRRAVNLALGYGPPPALYALLRRALASGARPSAVLVEFHPDSLSRPPTFGARIWPEVLEPGELLGLALAARDPGLFASVAAAEVLPTLRNRDRVRAAVSAALKGEADTNRGLNRMLVRNKRVNAGALIQPVKPFDGGIKEEQRRSLLRTPWAPSTVGRAYVGRFLDLAEARGVRVFWVIPPFCPKLRDARAAVGLDRSYAAFARGFQARHPGLTVIDGSGAGAGYGDELFCDAVHLNRRGAAAYTEAVGAAVASLLAAGRDAPRWAALPPYRPVPDGALEDLVQSFVANLAEDTQRGTVGR